MKPTHWVSGIIVPFVCVAGIASAGTLYEYEGFSYTAGSSINSQNGGYGWSGGWGTPGGLDATVAPGSLSFGALAVSGRAISTAGFQPPNQGSSVAYWTRNLGTLAGADNTTTYLSFLLRPDAGYGFYGGINFGNLYIGLSGNQSFYGLEGPLNVSLSNVPVAPGQAVLLVVRFDFLPGNDRVSLYVNPAAGQPEPAIPSVLKTDVDVGPVNSLTINNYGGFTIDEIRVGSSFDAVVPLSLAVPTGSTAWMVLAAGALVFLGIRAMRPAPR